MLYFTLGRNFLSRQNWTLIFGCSLNSCLSAEQSASLRLCIQLFFPLLSFHPYSHFPAGPLTNPLHPISSLSARAELALSLASCYAFSQVLSAPAVQTQARPRILSVRGTDFQRWYCTPSRHCAAGSATTTDSLCCHKSFGSSTSSEHSNNGRDCVSVLVWPGL